MRTNQYYLFLILLLFVSLNVEAACDGATTELGVDCVHYQSTASYSFRGLFTTRGQACDQVHRSLDERLRVWAEAHCIDKAWRPDREASQRTCRTLQVLSSATRGVRCLRGLIMSIEDPYSFRTCQESHRRQYTAVKNAETGYIDIYQNYGYEFARKAESLAPCEGDIRTATRRCSFVVRDYSGPQIDCFCSNGSCELKERLNSVSAPEPVTIDVNSEGASQ
jgi:hypothetical protein